MTRTSFLICLILGIAALTPTKGDSITIDKDFYTKDNAIIEAEHEVINIITPINNINIYDSDEDTTDNTNNTTNHLTLLFVQADIDGDGKKTEQGMYIYKNGNVKKLLDTGRDASTGDLSTKIAYIGAKDGIYKYNDTDETITKYGTIDIPVQGIIKVIDKDLIFALTDYNLIYKVTEQGTINKEVEAIENAMEMVMDYGNNIYYYTKDKKVNVYNETKGVTAVTGLPETDINYIKLVRPMVVFEDRTFIIINNNVYAVFANGTSKPTEFEVKEKPTAIAMDFKVLQFYAHGKKIYEYDLTQSDLVNRLPERLKKFIKPFITENDLS